MLRFNCAFGTAGVISQPHCPCDSLPHGDGDAVSLGDADPSDVGRLDTFLLGDTAQRPFWMLASRSLLLFSWISL